MAITTFKTPVDDFDINVQHLAIGGKLVTASFEMTQQDSLLAVDAQLMDNVKRKLAQQLVDYIMQNKLCEFTKQEDMYRGVTMYRARCYIATDEQVKLLRIHSIK